MNDGARKGLAVFLSLSALAGGVCMAGEDVREAEQAAYPKAEACKERPGVKYGEMIQKGYTTSGRYFPGTQRTIQVCVPPDYDGKTPACFCVMFDGIGFSLPTASVNLALDRKIPSLILIGVPPGRVLGTDDRGSARSNRTFEFDTPSPRMGFFLKEEILPFVETFVTSDGRKVLLSKNGNDHMIAGMSSGAACAFTVAWHFPELFPRVLSFCGSYTGLRGSYAYPTLIHKVEPKALRVFQQSGTHDMWTAFGDWWSANQAMERAFEFAGYEHAHEFGIGTHSGFHGENILPQALEYLWKGWPGQPVQASKTSNNQFLRELKVADHPFAAVGRADPAAGLVSDGKGGVASALNADGSRTLAIGPAARLVAADSGIRLIGADGNVSVASQKCVAARAVALRSGAFFVSGSERGGVADTLWRVTADGAMDVVERGLKDARALAVDASGGWLYVFEAATRRGFSWKILEDGTAALKQEFFFLHVRDEDDGTLAGGAVCDRSGRTYLATACGVQVCDYNGRSAAILTLPGGMPACAVAFGGPKMNVLYVVGADGVLYTRELTAEGDSILKAPAEIRVGAG